MGAIKYTALVRSTLRLVEKIGKCQDIVKNVTRLSFKKIGLVVSGF